MSPKFVMESIYKSAKVVAPSLAGAVSVGVCTWSQRERQVARRRPLFWLKFAKLLWMVLSAQSLPRSIVLFSNLRVDSVEE